MLVCGIGNRTNILHLECVGTRRLGVHQLRIWFDQSLDTGTDFRVVILDFHAKAREHRIAEISAGRVNRIDDQSMVARRQVGQKRHRDSCQP
ncbi:hypothetical protein D3C73_797820 [compost metagenome]